MADDYDGDLRIVNICSGGGGGEALSRAAAALMQDGLPLELQEFSSEEVDKDERAFQKALRAVEEADLVLLRLHGGAPYFQKFDRFIASVPEGVQVFLQSEVPEEMGDHRHRFRFPEEDFRRVLSCVKLGGEENERALLLWAGRKLRSWDLEAPEPAIPRTEGVYHPDHPSDVTLEDYLESLSPGRPTAGLMFYQGHWLSGSLQAVDFMIASLESQGLNVIPVFYLASPDELTGSLGAKGTFRRYFMGEEGARVDVTVLTMGFSQLRLSDPGEGSQAGEENFFAELGVPVIQAGFTYSSSEEWRSNQQGIGPFEMSGNVIWPEYDGQVIASPIGAMEHEPGRGKELKPIEERAVAMAKAAKRMASLRHVPVGERRVAVVLYQNPPRRDSLGGAFGLDTPQSVAALLRALSDDGYRLDHVPEDGGELIAELLAGLANDEDWLSAREMRERAAGAVSAADYRKWLEAAPDRCREEMVRDWGKPPGEHFTIDGEILVPGVINGNVFIAVQPPRGSLQMSEELYHSEHVVIPHSYLSYYRWIRDVFKADAVVHMGTHGTLEWLPGKSLALSEECYPDLVLGDMVNIYPYLMSNPGEGMQAKRRSRAVIVDHMPPAMARAGGYEDLERLDNELQAYFHTVRAGSKDEAALERIVGQARESELLSDLGLPHDAPSKEVEGHLPRLYDYLSELRDSLIKDGLHIFGSPPEGERLEETVMALTRLRNGEVPSLRESLAACMGFDLREASRSPSAYSEVFSKLNGTLLEEADGRCWELVRELGALGYETGPALALLRDKGLDSEGMLEVVGFICSTLVPGIKGARDEMGNLLRALDGGYVPPAPSGVPSRGNAHLLPSGRNFYSLDPRSIPTPAAWETGRNMAQDMVDRYISENGSYPESIGMVVFATDTMKTGGDDVAYILWLMGLRPVWADDGGRVVDIEVMPVEELGRPRIDITLRISGLFRDAFPNLIDLIDRGVETISSLDESPEENYLRKHLQDDMVRSMREGMGENEARSRALIRVFGCPPGTYGGGVSELIESSSWESLDDIAEAFVSWGGYAYGGGRNGSEAKDLLRSRLSQVDATVKNHSSRELDMLDNDDDYIYHGGMIAAVRSAKGDSPQSFVGDSSDPEATKLRTAAEEARFIFRSRVLNPKWLEGLKKHGYRGAQELSAGIDYAFAWDAAADIIEPWMYQSLARQFLFDDVSREWMEENSPHALRHMSGKLLEAIDRRMWSPDSSTRERLESMYLDAEDILEGDDG